MRAVTACLAALLALQPALAAGQDATPQDEPAAAPEPICLPLEVHQRITADLRELAALRERMKLYDQAVQLRDEQISDLKQARDLSVQAQTELRGSLDAMAAQKREAEESRDAWHRNPTLWLVVGVVGSLVIAITVDKLQE